MSPDAPAAADLVVLLDEHARAAGTMDRSAVHGRDTPLHLAFSVYLFDAAGQLLVTRRALTKRTWPGVWTNSCCGHVRPGEQVADAVRRRVAEELTLDLSQLRLVLPEFAYRATSPEGVVENEVCPVFVARTDREPRPDPAEVAEWRWVDWKTFRVVAEQAAWSLSPWAALQTLQLPVGHPLAVA